MDFEFKARVIKGESRGHKLGFPTANLDKTDLSMNFGVYKVEAVIDGCRYFGLLHWGLKETFDNKKSNELWIKDFNQNIYGKEVTVKVIKKIRDIKKFKNESELKEQIKKDTKEV